MMAERENNSLILKKIYLREKKYIGVETIRSFRNFNMSFAETRDRKNLTGIFNMYE